MGHLKGGELESWEKCRPRQHWGVMGGDDPGTGFRVWILFGRSVTEEGDSPGNYYCQVMCRSVALIVPGRDNSSYVVHG